jgi:hypothetical protein
MMLCATRCGGPAYCEFVKNALPGVAPREIKTYDEKAVA